MGEKIENKASLLDEVASASQKSIANSSQS
jgi:hypothetical protein